MPSSVILHFSFDKKTKLLKITFITGITYKYKRVPNKTFEMFKAANSKGRYFNDYIKDKYSFEKVEEV